MSKIVITIDTEEKTISAKVDGSTYENVQNVSVYKYLSYEENEPELECYMSLADEKDGDVMKRTTICTANSKDGKLALSNSKAEILSNKDGIVIVKTPKSIGEVVGNILKNKKSK